MGSCYIQGLAVHLPDLPRMLDDPRIKLPLSDSERLIFKRFYGLHTLHLAEGVSMYTFVSQALRNFLQTATIYPEKIDFLIHVHTANAIAPYYTSVIQQIKREFGFHHAITFASTQYKCVSSIQCLMLLTKLFPHDRPSQALLLTGEIAFTSELRLIPRTSLASDVSTLALISNRGEHHHLLATVIKHLRGYSQGFELNLKAFQKFECQFMEEMKQVIFSALQQARIKLDQLKLILPHNVNLPTWEKLAKYLGVNVDKIYTKLIAQIGHAFSSDIWINIQHAESMNYLQKGDYYLVVNCGMGFYLGCAVFQY